MTRHSRMAIVALAAAVAVLSLMLTGMPGKAAAQDIPEDMPLSGNGDFIAWMTEPLGASMLVFIAIFLAGALAGIGLMYLEYHVFKLSFERLGRVLLFVMPLTAVAAVAGTLALHKYNLFLLSLYLDIPLLGAPIAYVLYNRLLVEESDRRRL